MRVALDTNILAYAEGVDDLARKKIAVALVRSLDEGSTLLVQVLGELFRSCGKPSIQGQRPELSFSAGRRLFH
jgi:predicted nucleic acid-binding protein